MSTLLVYEKTLSRGKKFTGGERIFDPANLSRVNPEIKKWPLLRSLPKTN